MLQPYKLRGNTAEYALVEKAFDERIYNRIKTEYSKKQHRGSNEDNTPPCDLFFNTATFFELNITAFPLPMSTRPVHKRKFPNRSVSSNSYK